MGNFVRQLGIASVGAAVVGGMLGFAADPSRFWLVSLVCVAGVVVVGSLLSLAAYVARDLDARGEPGWLYGLLMCLLFPFLGPFAVLLILAAWQDARRG